MYVQVRGAVHGLAGQPVDVPELGRVGVAVQNVVHAESRAPIWGKREVHVRVPFAVAAALDLVVRRERLSAEIAIFESAAPGSEVLHINVEGTGCGGRIGQIATNVAGSIVEVRREACMIA